MENKTLLEILISREGKWFGTRISESLRRGHGIVTLNDLIVFASTHEDWELLYTRNIGKKARLVLLSLLSETGTKFKGQETKEGRPLETIVEKIDLLIDLLQELKSAQHGVQPTREAAEVEQESTSRTSSTVAGG